MFFSQELLSRRDSGFGLLWLAATLGSKSAFNKLPKRSVLTADISQLCGLIIQPSEPLALRLSSNLLVGVARVYKVKQDIFLSDVTTCSTSLKKIIQDMKSPKADSQLQMTLPTLRSSALTLPLNNPSFSIDIDALIADWDSYLNPDCNSFNGNEFDSSYDGYMTPSHSKFDVKKYTLDEHHHQFLSSFDAPYPENYAMNPTSEDYRTDNDDLFGLSSDNLDISGLANELATELGWISTGPGSEEKQVTNELRATEIQMPSIQNFDTVGNGESLPAYAQDEELLGNISQTSKSANVEFECIPPGGSEFAANPPNFATSISGELPLNVTTGNTCKTTAHNSRRKKLKAAPMILDARIELTDDELKFARAKYLHVQEAKRCDIHDILLERYYDKIIGDMIWGAPECIRSPVLVDFWKHIIKIQADGLPNEQGVEQGLPRKRQRYDDQKIVETKSLLSSHNHEIHTVRGTTEEYQVSHNLDHLRSSEEPGQGRQKYELSMPYERVGQNHDLGITAGGSQESTLFPWDDAAGTAISGGWTDRNISVDLAEVPIRPRSWSKRDSSVLTYQTNMKVSPIPVMIENSLPLSEDYQFDVSAQDGKHTRADDLQDLDPIHASLHKMSFNFLEYVKMQYHSRPSPRTSLTLSDMIPPLTSTRHVAASAFYHCLVLASKDLLRLTYSDSRHSLVVSIV